MVHQYKLNGYNIVLDTCSGSVHSVDDVAYDIIAMYKTASREEIVNAVMKNTATDPTSQEMMCFFVSMTLSRLKKRQALHRGQL